MTQPPEAPQPPTAPDRKKSVLLGASSGYLSTLVTTALSFITVPLALGYFGVERYGALVLMGTVAGYLGITGLGIPTAALMLAGRMTDRVRQLRVIGKGALLTGGGALLLVSLLLLIGDSDLLLKTIGEIPEEIRSDVRRALFWSLVMFLLNLPFTGLNNGFIALRKPHLERLYFTLGTATYLVALAVTVWRRGSLTDLVLLRGTLTVLVGVAGGIHLFLACARGGAGIRQTLRQLAQPDREPAHSARVLLSSGSTFLAGGVAMMVIMQTDTLVISHMLGIGAVAPYQVTFRLVTLGFVLFTAVTPSLLPLYGAAWEDDHPWIERTANTMLQVAAALGGLVWIGGAAFAEAVVHVWAGADAYAGLPTVLALGGYGYSLAVSSQLFVLLTSRNRIRNVPLIRWVEAGSNLLLSLVLVRFLGVAGAALGTWFASLITITWLLPREIRRQTSESIAVAYRPVLVHLFAAILPALAAVILVNELVPWPVWRLAINGGIVILYGYVSTRQVPAASRALLKVVRPIWAPNPVE